MQSRDRDPEWNRAQRFARLLTDLATMAGRRGTTLPGASDGWLCESRRETGPLGAAFKAVLERLREKEALETRR